MRETGVRGAWTLRRARGPPAGDAGAASTWTPQPFCAASPTEHIRVDRTSAVMACSRPSRSLVCSAGNPSYGGQNHWIPAFGNGVDALSHRAFAPASFVRDDQYVRRGDHGHQDRRLSHCYRTDSPGLLQEDHHGAVRAINGRRTLLLSGRTASGMDRPSALSRRPWRLVADACSGAVRPILPVTRCASPVVEWRRLAPSGHAGW